MPRRVFGWRKIYANVSLSFAKKLSQVLAGVFSSPGIPSKIWLPFETQLNGKVFEVRPWDVSLGPDNSRMTTSRFLFLFYDLVNFLLFSINRLHFEGLCSTKDTNLYPLLDTLMLVLGSGLKHFSPL
jgi:hypothetical protein